MANQYKGLDQEDYMLLQMHFFWLMFHYGTISALRHDHGDFLLAEAVPVRDLVLISLLILLQSMSCFCLFPIEYALQILLYTICIFYVLQTAAGFYHSKFSCSGTVVSAVNGISM